MENFTLEKITEILQTFSAWAIALTTICAGLSAIFKPVRNFFAWGFKHFFNTKPNEEIMKQFEAMGGKIDKLSTRLDEVSDKVDAVSEKNDKNERDRLKHVIFQYGNFARKKQRISSEEFRYIQESFDKYTILGGNGNAHKEMDFITDYYNHQDWTTV